MRLEGQVDTIHVQKTAPAWFTDSLHSVEHGHGAIAHFKHSIRRGLDAELCDFHYICVFLELKYSVWIAQIEILGCHKTCYSAQTML